MSDCTGFIVGHVDLRVSDTDTHAPIYIDDATGAQVDADWWPEVTDPREAWRDTHAPLDS